MNTFSVLRGEEEKGATQQPTTTSGSKSFMLSKKAQCASRTHPLPCLYTFFQAPNALKVTKSCWLHRNVPSCFLIHTEQNGWKIENRSKFDGSWLYEVKVNYAWKNFLLSYALRKSCGRHHALKRSLKVPS